MLRVLYVKMASPSFHKHEWLLPRKFLFPTISVSHRNSQGVHFVATVNRLPPMILMRFCHIHIHSRMQKKIIVADVGQNTKGIQTEANRRGGVEEQISITEGKKITISQRLARLVPGKIKALISINKLFLYI